VCFSLWALSCLLFLTAIFLTATVLLLLPLSQIAILPEQSAVAVGNLCANEKDTPGGDAFSLAVSLVADNPAGLSVSLDPTDMHLFHHRTNDLLASTAIPDSLPVDPGLVTVKYRSTIRPRNVERWAEVVSSLLSGGVVRLRVETTVTIWVLGFIPLSVDVKPTFRLGGGGSGGDDDGGAIGAFLRALKVVDNTVDALKVAVGVALNATKLKLIAVEVPELSFLVKANTSRPSKPDDDPFEVLTATTVTTTPFVFAPGWSMLPAVVELLGIDAEAIGEAIGGMLEDGAALVDLVATGIEDARGCFIQSVVAKVAYRQVVKIANQIDREDMMNAAMNIENIEDILDMAVTSTPNTAPLGGQPGVVDPIAPPTATPTVDPAAASAEPTPAPAPPLPREFPRSPHIHSLSLIKLTLKELHLAALISVSETFEVTGPLPPLRATLGPFAVEVDEIELELRDDNLLLMRIGVADDSTATLVHAFKLVAEMMAGEEEAKNGTTVYVRGEQVGGRNDTITRIIDSVYAQLWPTPSYRRAVNAARARIAAAQAARENAMNTMAAMMSDLYESVHLDVTSFDETGFVAVANVTIAGASLRTNITLPELTVDLIAETPGYEGARIGSVSVSADVTLDGGEEAWGGALLTMRFLLDDPVVAARAFVEPWFYNTGEGTAVRLRGRGAEEGEDESQVDILRRFVGQLDHVYVLGATPTTADAEAAAEAAAALQGVDGPLTVTVDSVGDDSLRAHARFSLPTGWLGTSSINDTVILVGHAPRSPGLSDGSALDPFVLRNRLAKAVLSLVVDGEVAEARLVIGDVVTTEAAALMAAVWGSQEHSVLLAGTAEDAVADHWLQRLLNEVRLASDVVRHASAAPDAPPPRDGSTFAALTRIDTVYDDSDPGWLHAEATLAMQNRLLQMDIPPLSLTLHNRSCPLIPDHCHVRPLLEIRLNPIAIRRHRETERVRISIAVRDGRALDELVSSVLAKRPYQVVLQGSSGNQGLFGALLRDARLGVSLYDPAGAADRGDASAGAGISFSTAFTLRDTTTDTLRLNLRMVADVARTVPWSVIDIGVLAVTMRVDGALIATVTTPDIVLRQGERFQGDTEIVVSAAESREYFESIVTRLFDLRAQLDFDVSGSLDKPDRRDEANWEAPVALEMSVRVPPVVAPPTAPGVVEPPRSPGERTLLKCIEVTAKRFQLGPCKPDLDLLVWLENPVAVLPLELVELHVVVDFDDVDGGWGSGAANDIEIGRIDDLQAVTLPAGSIVPYATTLIGTDRGVLELCTRLADELLDNTLTLDIAPLIAVIRIEHFYMTVRVSIADIFVNMDGPKAIPCATQIATDYPDCRRSNGGGFICD
jgi:hypothetical protein